MPTNVNLPVWTSGEATFSGGGVQAAVLIPSDIDTVVIDLSDATGADVVSIDVSQNVREDIVGITERPLRYNNDVAVNDLGSTGELRINAGSALDFTVDGWAVGDTFEIISHRVPGFGPQGTHPTTLGDTEIYTITSVAAKVIVFSEDPGYSLAEGSIVVAQSRAAVIDGSLSYANQTGLDGSNTEASVTVSGVAGRKIRLNQSTGTDTVTWEFRGLLQSGVRPAPFVAQVEDRPFASIPTEKAFLTLPSVADGAVVTWDEVVTVQGDGARRQARATVAGANFDSDGLQNYDRVFVGGHSPTGNGGLYTVNSRVPTAVTFKEPLKGVAGVDTPGRSKWRYLPATIQELLPSDYDELVFNDMGVSNGSFYNVTDETTDPLTDFGPSAEGSMADDTSAVTLVDGPWTGARAVFSTAFQYNDLTYADGAFGASGVGTIEGWYRFDVTSGNRYGWVASPLGSSLQVTAGTTRVFFTGATLPDPGVWVTGEVHATGARRRVTGDAGARVQEVEVAGAASALLAGEQVVDIGSDKALADVPGLANDATVYTAAVTVDGGSSQPIAVTGSTAQTFTLLLSELNTDTTGAVWSLNDGDLVCISSTTGETSTIAVVDTDLFLALTGFVAVNAAVAGDGEPTFDGAGGTVTDGILAAGFHDGDYGSLLLAATATGLVNDATVYTAAVTVDGGSSQPIAITGSTAQTYATLLTELDTDTTGATWSLKNGELRCTSDTTGASSTVAIVDTDLLSTLTDFVSLNTAVPGTAVATWRDAGARSSFQRSTTGGTGINGVAHMDPSQIPVAGEWIHLALTREANGQWKLYFDAVLVDTLTPPVADSSPGTFGLPRPFQNTVDFSNAQLHLGDLNDEDSMNGAFSKVAYYHTALTQPQIQAHFDKGVELGLLA